MLSSMRSFICSLQLVQGLRHQAATLQAWREFMARIYVRGEGIEIGALNRPLGVSNGAKVNYKGSRSIAMANVIQ